MPPICAQSLFVPPTNCAKKKVKRRGLLVASRQRACLLDVETSELQAGQSKSYAFQVGVDTENHGSDNVGISSGNGDSSGDIHNPDSKNAGSKVSNTSSSAGPASEAAKVS